MTLQTMPDRELFELFDKLTTDVTYFNRYLDSHSPNHSTVDKLTSQLEEVHAEITHRDQVLFELDIAAGEAW